MKQRNMVQFNLNYQNSPITKRSPQKILHWDGITIYMNSMNLKNKEEFNKKTQLVTNPKTTKKATEQVTENLDTHYE